MDYSAYQLSFREKSLVFLRTMGITAAIMWLFYRSMWAALIFPLIFAWQLKNAKQQGLENRKAQIENEFVNGITVLNSSLQAGLSMENAWKEVEKEIKFLYGSDALFYLELREINQMVANNVPIEKLFLEFAYKCKVEDVIQFAEILDYGKRSGSNWKRIIDSTVSRIAERYEAKQQIEVMVAEKKLEQQVMNLMPLGILGFLQLSAWDYMKVLYHNWFGVISMTIFLLAYMIALWLSQKILKVSL